jgi:hypothetical protein
MEDLRILYCHLAYFTAIWPILWPIGLFCDHLVYIFCGYLVYFPVFFVCMLTVKNLAALACNRQPRHASRILFFPPSLGAVNAVSSFFPYLLEMYATMKEDERKQNK